MSAAPLRATYRLQLQPGFGFEAAAGAVPALAELGISHLYLSPCFAARHGSTHGYDVVDYGRFSPALGSFGQFEALVACLRTHGMGLILDLVPNHMGVMGSENRWWLDLMEHGRASAHADYFDVDWTPLRQSLHGRVLVPVLGGPFGDILESGDLRLALAADAGGLRFEYHEHLFPLDPADYGTVLGATGDAGLAALGARFAALPSRDEEDPAARAERRTAAAALKTRLAALCAEPQLRAAVEQAVGALNGAPGDPGSFDALESLLARQAYRLSHWRVASDEINYRRFFDINDLAALCVERDDVFTSVHAFVAELAARGLVDGVRIDHADGLYDPVAYLARLRDALPGVRHVFVEKILGPHERLPEDWAADGTTGYDFGRLVGAWLLPPEAAEPMSRIYAAFIGSDEDFDTLAVEAKRRVLAGPMVSEANLLAARLDRIARRDRHTADFTRERLKRAIVEVIAFFPVYRTYASSRGIAEGDLEHLRWALARARSRSHAEDTSVYDFLEAVLTLRHFAEGPEARRAEVLEFAMRFQQLCAPAMAKGVEDTAFYLYNRFAALNEVGGDPRRFGLSNGALHQSNRERRERLPFAMLATSTHDSKRSEDLRARLAALAELPDRWRRGLVRWNRLNRPRKRIVGGRRAPSRNDEYLFYQALLGLWPEGPREPAALAERRDRLVAYMQKAAREAKCETSWEHPHEAYEAALGGWIERLMGRGGGRFLDDFEPLARDAAALGAQNSLSQTLLKLTCPGVPDIYQGCEREYFALVDPDNRAPLDPRSLSSDRPSAKLDLTRRLLALRRREPELFSTGSYEPLAVEGPAQDSLLAFARRQGPAVLVVIVPRFPGRRLGVASVPEFWRDTWVEWPAGAAPEDFADALTGAQPRVEAGEGRLRLHAATLPAAFPGAAFAAPREAAA